MTMKHQKSDRYGWWGLILVFIYILPYLISGDGHYICVHDFLDSTVAHIKSMKDMGVLFDYSATMPILSGIPRYVYGSFLDIKLWLFAILPTYPAIVANVFLIKLTAFYGMYALMCGYIARESDKKELVSFLTAGLFTLVPFYVDYGVSAAGIPMMTWAFLNLFNGRKPAASIITMVFYAFYSWFVLSGFFVCILAAVSILVFWIRGKQFPVMPFVGLFIFSAACLVVNWELVVQFLTPGGETMHRVEFGLADSYLTAIGESLGILLISQYHAGTCLAALILVMFFILWKKNGRENKVLQYLMTGWIVLSSLIFVGTVAKVALSGIALFREFQFDRFFFLYPAMCFMLMGAVTDELVNSGKVRTFSIAAAALTLVNLSFDVNGRCNMTRLLGIEDIPSFRQYYDVELFQRIKEENGIADFVDKVACFGMCPAVAEYNDMATADGYIQMYPLEYKHRFQKVIQGELDKSEDLKTYFCDWGSRCYLFSSQLGRNYLFSREADITVDDLDIDTSALAALGCRFILSSVAIGNAQRLGLDLAGSYSDPDSYWNIRVYRLPGSDSR